MKGFLLKHLEKVVMGVLTFLSVWMFNTVIEMKTTMIKLEQKLNDDQTQWELIKSTIEAQNDLYVTVQFHDLLLKQAMQWRLDSINKGTKALDSEKLELLRKELENRKNGSSIKDFIQKQKSIK
jgi:hypothetical protein